MICDPEVLSSEKRSALLLSIILPRPIALVTTLNTGRLGINVAPFSLFNLVSLAPPVVYISIQKTNPPKRTATNIKETKEFVINIPSYKIAEKMNKTAISRSLNKLEFCNLTQVKSEEVETPGIKETLIRLECKLYDIIDFEGYEMFLGKVLNIFCEDSILDNSQVSIDKHEFISRLGPKEVYLKVKSSNIFKMERYTGNVYEGG